MKMKNSDILGTMIRTKLKLSERVIALLPDDIKPAVKEAEKAVLTAIHDGLGQYLQQANGEVQKPGIKKVEVE